MDLIDLKYGVIPQNDYVLIVGAGPSTRMCLDKIRVYIKKYRPLIFAANYNFETECIMSNYTYITDPEKFVENIHKINSDLIIPFKLKYMLNFNSASKKYCKLHTIFVAGNADKFDYLTNNNIKIKKNGSLTMNFFGIAGFGAMTVSMVAKPKHMLIVGIDDPKKNKDHKFTYKGEKMDYLKPEKCTKVIDHFYKILVPLIKSRGIEIETFEEVSLLGFSKTKLGIKII